MAASVRQSIPGHFKVERARLHGPLAGRYMIHPRTQGVPPKTAYCRLQRVTAESMSFAGLAGGEAGDTASVHFKELGILTGRITRTIGALIIMDIDVDERQRRKLDSLIGWLDRKHRLRLPDHRRAVRFVPKNPETRLSLPDGSDHECSILDLSVGGAAIACDSIPRIGDSVLLGRVMGRVVRHTPEGFAIQFNDRQPQDEVELLVGSEAVALL